MPIAEFRDLMGQTVTVAPFTSFDAYGEPTFGTAVSYPARVVGKVRLVRDVEGREVVSSQTIYLGSNANVGVRDRVTLSTDFTGSTDRDRLTPPVLAVGRYPDETGLVHHATVFLK